VPPGQSTPVSWTIDGTPRSALVHLPSAASAGTPLPVVVGLHGYGGFGLEMEMTSELSDASNEQGWLVVYPEGTGTPEAWNDDPAGTGHAADMAFIRRVIDDVVRQGCGDPKRVIVTGISQGGWLSDMVGCEMTDLVAGVVPVAGRDMGWGCKPKKPIPFTAVNGVLDDVLPYQGGPVDAAPPLTSVDSVDDWLAARAASRGCVGKPTEAKSSPHVVLETWSGCAASVALYRVEDGGHSWPNGGGYGPVDHELSVTKVIADMLAES
jgi:polyhydroxybutyrate depolymerase